MKKLLAGTILLSSLGALADSADDKVASLKDLIPEIDRAQICEILYVPAWRTDNPHAVAKERDDYNKAGCVEVTGLTYDEQVKDLPKGLNVEILSEKFYFKNRIADEPPKEVGIYKNIIKSYKETELKEDVNCDALIDFANGIGAGSHLLEVVSDMYNSDGCEKTTGLSLEEQMQEGEGSAVQDRDDSAFNSENIFKKSIFQEIMRTLEYDYTDAQIH